MSGKNTDHSIPSVEFEVNYKDPKEIWEGIFYVVSQLCPWANGVESNRLEIEEIRGGITNLLYRVYHKDHSKEEDYAAMVRIFGEKSEVLIDRDKDNQVFKHFSDLKFGPHLYGIFGNGRVEGWVESRPLDPPEMGKTSPVDFQKLIAQQVARMHDLHMPGDGEPSLWKTLYKWYDMAADIKMEDEKGQQKVESLNLQWVYKELGNLQRSLPSEENKNGNGLFSSLAATTDSRTREARVGALKDAFSVAFCHNDLLSGNVLHMPRKEEVMIIDYEYGGFNYVGFDIANHFCEYAGFDFDLDKWYPSKQSQYRFFEHYLDSRKSVHWNSAKEDQTSKEAYLDQLYIVVNKFALASHFFWGLWALVQAKYSPIDFDFLQYSVDRINGYRKQVDQF
eukprot:gb/GECG01011474.1/.p1 GENE.gb/GECG01011474.1/~~gb/GECG01011474.1/.p1  ORF type:complete len:393 (+),score=53.55 gb/GECG01011474.1/:1-1179(+)